jgi:hypothetical protein
LTPESRVFCGFFNARRVSAATRVFPHRRTLVVGTIDHDTEARFDRLSTQSKHFIDIIKMIAYRAETAMAQILRQNMTRHDDARSLLRAIYSTEVDIVPDPQANTLTIRLRPLANTSRQPIRKWGVRARRPPCQAQAVVSRKIEEV